MAWSALNPQVDDWRGRSVWLVGASSGIGHACAQALIAAFAADTLNHERALSAITDSSLDWDAVHEAVRRLAPDALPAVDRQFNIDIAAKLMAAIERKLEAKAA